MIPAVLNSRVYLTSTAKRSLIVAAVLLLLYITLGNTRQSWSHYRAGWQIRPEVELSYADGFHIPLNHSQWGERGRRVQRLAEWAALLVQHPAQDRKLFQDALTQQFPFLAGTENSIYTPWASPINESFSRNVGFVVCAGSNNFHLAAHLIRSLRRVHGSKSPIEIAYAGDTDLRPEHRTFLANLESDISFIDLLERYPTAQDDLVGSGWATKPFALLASSHTRAILVDADALFLVPPDSLFEDNPGLVRTGTLLFHDRAAVGGGDERRFWLKAQVEVARGSASHYLETESLFYSGAAWYEADSGVVALDKSRPSLLLGLIFATWMNTKEIREKITYDVFYGDKETFWVAMELSSTEYFFQPWYAGSMGTIANDTNQPPDSDLANNAVEICGKHMLHLDHVGQTPFWINGGVYEHKEDPEKGYAEMTHYWVGDTADMRLTQPQWYWVNGNTACLREKGVKVIPERVRQNIDKVKAEAKLVDQMIKKQNL